MLELKTAKKEEEEEEKKIHCWSTCVGKCFTYPVISHQPSWSAKYSSHRHKPGVACARVRKTGPPSHIHWLHVWSKQPQTSVRRGLQYRTTANDVKICQKKENWSVWKCHSYENNHIKIKAFKQIMSTNVRKLTFGHVRPVKIQSRLCGWAGRFESSLGAHVNYFFWHCDFYMVESQFSISTAVPLLVTQIYLFK